MGNAFAFDRFAFMGGSFSIPSSRGAFDLSSACPVSRQLLPTDPIGTFALTLTNVVVGSAIQIEDRAGTTTLHNGTATTSSPLINLSAYSGGSGLNDLRIKVRKASSGTTYKPFETLTTAVVGSQSIYISQIQDE